MKENLLKSTIIILVLLSISSLILAFLEKEKNLFFLSLLILSISALLIYFQEINHLFKTKNNMIKMNKLIEDYKFTKNYYSHHKFEDINKIKTPTDLSNLSLKHIRTLFNNLINNEKNKGTI